MGCMNAKGPGVTQYKGFKEHAYRLVFPYEEHFPNIDPVPSLLTILPSGSVENTKALVAEKERALIAYTFSQQIKKDVIAGKTVDYADSPWHGKAYTETPFVKGTGVGDLHTLVQTWPTKFNEKFKQDFTVTENNPDNTKFAAAAVADFKACVEQMFGGQDATKKVPIKFCHKETKNEFPCYEGKTEDLLMYLQDNVQAMNAVGIKEMTQDGFVATGEDGKGNKVEKPFSMDPKTEYVIYKKVGWETMGCCKTKAQFENECEFLGKGERMECK